MNIMNYKEKWDLLLGEKRFRPKSETIETDARNSFDRDYSKLVFSAPVRRLQGKTQVFPLPDDDYPRTRLTHSMEVSFLGGSIGRSIESILMGKDEISQECFGYLPSLLRVAGLVHDLGNTPFGHFGEKAIGDFFKSFFENNPGCGLSSIEKADLENFDGNVQTFRILTKLHYFGDNLSYNLSYQTLSSVLKYPVDSLTGNKGKSAKSISYKKFGYFQSEVEEFSKIVDYLHLGNNRNPVTFILEAADDIAYRSADIEDSVKQGVCTIDEVIEYVESVLDGNPNSGIIRKEFNRLNEKYATLSTKIKNRLFAQKIRVFTQRIMIDAVIKAFRDNYQAIMEGAFNEELLKVSSANDVNNAFKELFNNVVLKDKSITRLEIAGYKAIRGLLNLFVPAVLDDNLRPGSFNDHLVNMISDEQFYIYENYSKKTPYNRLQLAVDYVSGMTDSFAIDLFQRLEGIRV